MTITFVLHGKLRGISKLKKSILKVFEDGFQVDFLLTTAESGAKEPVRMAIENGADYIIISGGDGSINEGINGYMMVRESKRSAVVLGVLPLGTGNDFARSLLISKSLEELYLLIKKQALLNVDICKMTYLGLNNKSEFRYFINISDIGMGGLAAQYIKNSSKILGANLTYVKAVIASFFNYKKQAVSLTSPGFNWNGEMMSICMANGKYFGSGMCIAPDARLNDGLIQLTILGNIKLGDYLKNIFKLRKGVKILHKEVIYTSVSSLKIEALKTPCPIDMDGEFVGYTPIEVNILPRSVRMLGDVLSH